MLQLQEWMIVAADKWIWNSTGVRDSRRKEVVILAEIIASEYEKAVPPLYKLEDGKISVVGEAHRREVIDNLARAEKDEGLYDRIPHDLRTCPAMRALESLTPGGSEYIDDIPRCVETIRESRSSVMRELVRVKKQANEDHAPATPAAPDKLEKLLIATIKLAVIRHDLLDCNGEKMTEVILHKLALDTVSAMQGEGTCDETPSQEWTDAVAEAAPTTPQKATLICSICGQELRREDQVDAGMFRCRSCGKVCKALAGTQEKK